MQRYLYLDNYRGFSNTIIPIVETNFLVGENSTGKSSILALLHLLCDYKYWTNLEFNTDCVELGGFQDILSAAAAMKTSFKVGFLGIRPQSGHEVDKDLYASFAIMSFKNDNNTPKLKKAIVLIHDEMIAIRVSRESIFHKTISYTQNAMSSKEICDFFAQQCEAGIDSTEGFQELSISAGFPVDLPFMLDISRASKSSRQQHKFTNMSFPFYLFGIEEMKWLAPIRAKPKRTYDGFATPFTPEGDHTPYLIRNAFSSEEKAQKFKKISSEFGYQSGLFSNVSIHAFGEGPATPFEVQIELSTHALNISNVGYGVSQVLPILVEMLTSTEDSWFAFQQPEVHLHPRAQAALGDLLFYLAAERNLHFIIETHSEYLIDRFRLRTKNEESRVSSQVLYFQRSKDGNTATPLEIDCNGQYPKDQPDEFRRFFINEEIRLLEI